MKAVSCESCNWHPPTESKGQKGTLHDTSSSKLRVSTTATYRQLCPALLPTVCMFGWRAAGIHGVCGREPERVGGPSRRQQSHPSAAACLSGGDEQTVGALEEGSHIARCPPSCPGPCFLPPNERPLAACSCAGCWALHQRRPRRNASRPCLPGARRRGYGPRVRHNRCRGRGRRVRVAAGDAGKRGGTRRGFALTPPRGRPA